MTFIYEKGEVYSSRSEFKETLSDDSFEIFKQKIIDSNIIDNILKFPILNSLTKRTDVILDKNGVLVCLSFDNSQYDNHILNESVTDRMIEIEAIGELNNRIILNEIHNFITSSFKNLTINKQSKYERGINRTSQLYNCLEKQNNNQSFTHDSNVQVLIKKIQKND